MVLGDVYAAVLAFLQSQYNTAVSNANSANATAAQNALELLTKVTKVDLLTDLKALTPVTNAKVQLTGVSSLLDGKGGLYYWDSTSVVAEDTTYYNVVQSNVTSTGRWIRNFQRVRVTAGGATVLSIGPVKMFFATGVTDSSGNYTLNLTEEGTAGGTAIFSALWWYDARAITAAATLNDAIQTYYKSNTSNKSLVFGNYKANVFTVVLAAIVNPFISVGSGVNMLGWAIGT